MLRHIIEMLVPAQKSVSDYLAAPPRPVLASGWKKLLRLPLRLGSAFFYLLRHTLTPYEREPVEPAKPPPDSTETMAPEQLEQCRAMFDLVETTRSSIEGKAQSVFSLIMFLVPLLGTVMVYILEKGRLDPLARRWTISFMAASSLMIILAFLGAVRAVLVKYKTELFLDAVIDTKVNQIRKYNSSFHARGLLWCASMNSAINGHIAEFTKGAQVFAALAVLFLVVGALPVAASLVSEPAGSEPTEIVGTVTVSGLADQERSMIEIQARIHETLQALSAESRNQQKTDERLEQLERLVGKLSEPKPQRSAAPQRELHQ